MNRKDIAALRDTLDTLLRCSDAVLHPLIRWLQVLAGPDEGPEPVRPGNGLDPHPPPTAPTPYVGRSKHGRPKTSTKTAERKLRAAMADNPGLSVIALANAAGSSRSATGERLRQMALRGVVEKDLTGRWKLKREETEPGPTMPPSN